MSLHAFRGFELRLGVHWVLSRYDMQVGSHVDSGDVISCTNPLGRPDNSGASASFQHEWLPRSPALPRKDTSTTELRSVRRPFVSFLTTAYQTEDYLTE